MDFVPYSKQASPAMYRGTRMTSKAFCEEMRRLDHQLEGCYFRATMDRTLSDETGQYVKAAQTNLLRAYQTSNGKA